MRTTLDLAEPLLQKVKTRAVEEGVTPEKLMAGYIEAGLRESIHANAAPAIPAAPVKRPPPPIAWPADGHVTPARTNAELFRIMEVEDIENLRRIGVCD